MDVREQEHGSNEIAQSKQQPRRADSVFGHHAAWSFVEYDPERKYAQNPEKTNNTSGEA